MTTATVRIFPDVQPQDLRRLAASVCLRAVDELRGSDPLKALDALLFLTGPDFPTWAEVANVPFADPIKLLTGGKLNRTRVRTKGKTHE